MSKEEKFEYEIANLKKELSIENIIVTEEDIELLKKYYNGEFTLFEIISLIKKAVLEGVK